MHPAHLTAAQLGVTTAPNRTYGPRHPEPMPSAPRTGDPLLDRCRALAETANLLGELRIGARWHDLADRIADGVPGARDEAERTLPPEPRPLHPETVHKIELECGE